MWINKNDDDGDGDDDQWMWNTTRVPISDYTYKQSNKQTKNAQKLSILSEDLVVFRLT